MEPAPPLLVDSHVHLDRYGDEQVAAMVARAEAAGVRRLLTIGTDLASSRAALALAARYPGVLAAVGIHPTRLSRGGPTPQFPPQRSGEGEPQHDLKSRRHPGLFERSGAPSFFPLSAPERGPGGEVSLLQQHPSAIGEVGLDEHAPDLDAQARYLAVCLTLAEEHRLPLVLHVVGGPAIHEAALALVARHPRVRTVAHYFVGGPELARRYLEHGCWISVGRPVTRPAEVAVRQAVSLIPPDRLLLETDTYPLPGRTTEPRDIVTVCGAVAELTGRSFEVVAAQTTASFEAFIGNKRRDESGA
jgi:TatD DNase family protein